MTEESQFASQLSPAITSKWPLEHWSLQRLKPYSANARTHSRPHIAQIAASIEEFGFTNPLLVRSDGTIAAGHGRLEAAKLLGLTSVPVIVVDGWTEDQFRAYVLADNRLALNAGWDSDLLAMELAALKTSKFDVSLLGFDVSELGRLLSAALDPFIDPDGARALPAKPASVRGDLWNCGDHRVLCGDAADRQDVGRLLDGGRAHMCFTDPPYNVDYANCAAAKKQGKNRPILNDALGSGFEGFLRAACEVILEVTGGAVYICMSSAELDTLQRAFREAGGKWSTFLIWAKNTFTLGRSDYQRQYEPILYGWKEGTRHQWSGGRDQGDVWYYDKPSRSDVHPTMKPVALVERAILNSSKSNDIVLDPFGGSGTSLIAAWRTGRRARLLELDPRYIDVIVQRWQDLTGKIAVLDGDGRGFGTVRKDRHG